MSNLNKIIRVLTAGLFGLAVFNIIVYLIAYLMLFMAKITNLRLLVNPLFTYIALAVITGLMIGVGHKKGFLRDWYDALKGD